MALERLSANDLVAAFAGRLQRKKDDLTRIASFWNSFEGWLKWELALELCDQRWKRRPWSNQSAKATCMTIGVEYKAPLATRDAALARKQVDLWVSSDTSPERWHYIELKVAFKNSNSGKQLASWKNDLELLDAISDKGVDARLSLLVAVGFLHGHLETLVGTDATVTWVSNSSDDGEHSTPSVALVSLIGK